MSIEETISIIVKSHLAELEERLDEKLSKLQTTNYPPVIDIKTACELSTFGVNRMYELCRQKEFPAFKESGSYKIITNGFLYWLEKKQRRIANEQFTSN